MKLFRGILIHYILIIVFFSFKGSYCQDPPPKVLVVTAHPDDDAAFAGVNYKIVHDLDGIVDLAVITNGEGGYKYSTLAEPIYGLELTEESIGRKYLPDIRKKELEAGGKIVGIRNYFYFDQKDHRYITSEDLHEILDSNIWDLEYIKGNLSNMIQKEKYDYIFILTPSLGTHAHHSSAGILTLETVSILDSNIRPVVLGITVSRLSDTLKKIYKGFDPYPITSVSDTVPFAFDRTQKFGYNDALDYKIIVNWVIAEHKSQGTMQQLTNSGDIENYWYFDINPKSRLDKTRNLFDKLRVNNYPKKEYK